LAGCIVIYNPTISVIKNIESYIHALAVLYVIDNSVTINDDFATLLTAVSDKVIYLPQKDNIGIAAALNIGANAAIDAGYQWLLTMDQDSSFKGNDFFYLWKTQIKPLTNIGLVAASYTDKYDRWQKNYSDHFNEMHFAITSGNIINLIAWQQVNGFEEKLFIDEVDHDYCLKLNQKRYKILITKQLFLKHAIGHLHRKTLDGTHDEVEIKLHSPVRYYYMSRNVLYLCKKYIFTDFGFVIGRFYYLLKILIKIILRYPNKRVYLKFLFAGVKDFAGSNYYKYKKQ
jgi:rhamnosyltransferase